MAKTILDLFKSQKAEVYGDKGSETFIDTRGLINPPRKAALLASSPTSLGALVGNEAVGVLKGTANRPSDTIFKNKTFLSKPVSLFPGAITGVADSVEVGETYFIKKSPGPPSFVAKIEQGATNPKEELIKQTGQFLKNPASTLKGFKDLTGKLNRSTADGYASYGPEKSEDRDGKIIKEKGGVKFTTHGRKGGSIQSRGETDNLLKNGKSDFDDITYSILKNQYDTNLIDGKNRTNENTLEVNNKVNLPYVLISDYPSKTEKIYLPGTITGLSEDLSPEWNDFKYLGSPFKLYRYSGVERTIKFQLKLYYVDNESKKQMRIKLAKLKRLVFPNRTISSVKYPNTDNNGYSPLAYNPNILFLTINGIYTEIPCIMDSLSITIPDEAPWASNTESLNPDKNDKPYPIYIDVDMGFKIIEDLQVNEETYQYETRSNNGLNTYDYFDKTSEGEGGLVKTSIIKTDNPVSLKTVDASALNASQPGIPVTTSG